MAKSKTQADSGESRAGKSPPSAARNDRPRKGGKRTPAERGRPTVGKKDVGRGDGEDLH